MRGGADDSDAPDVAVMQRNQAPPRLLSSEVSTRPANPVASLNPG